MPEISQMSGRISLFRPVSYGLVAANKPLNSAVVEVTPVEDFQMADGQITDNVTQFQAQGTDAQGTAYQISTDQSSTITATWLAFGNPNRQTPPDVRRGEYVMLYQYGDADKYYWTTMWADLTLRKLETVIFGISATQKEGAPNENNTYILGISSHQKKIWLQTTKDNGEPYAYTMELDLDAGKFSLADDIGNIQYMDSANNTHRWENAVGSFLEINQNDISAFTANSMNFETQTMNFKAQQINTDASTITTNASGSITTTTPTNQINAQTTNAGDFNTTPGAGGPGKTVSSADFETTGKIIAHAGVETDATVKGNIADFQVYENLPN